MTRGGWLFSLLRPLGVSLVRLYWRVSVRGREHVPPTGAYIIAPVHRSNIDVFVVPTITRRRIRFMAKDSLWKVKAFGWLVEALGAFPVHRGTADREALRQSQAVLEAGEPLVLFPEGTRQSGPEVQPLFDGAAYLAARLGVPIVPVGIGGSERAMRKGSKLVRPVKVAVVVGPPLHPEARPDGGRVPRRAVRELTEQLHAELQRLFDQAQAAAGSPNPPRG